MPLEEINTAVLLVDHEEHRQQLHNKLGSLAHASILDVAQEQAELTIRHSETADRDETASARIVDQAHKTSIFFSFASQELGPEASEDDIWDKVFEYQLQHLKSSHTPEHMAYDIAANMLVTNLFAVYGLPPNEAQAKIDRRMWQVARAGAGMKVLAMAGLHKDLCVISDPSDRPYRSVAEQTFGFESLLLTTDPSVADRDINIPVEKLQDASADDKGWFFAKAAELRNYPLISTNRQYLTATETNDVARAAAKTFGGTSEEFNRMAIVPPVSEVQFGEWIIEGGRSPIHFVEAGKLDAAEQIKLFNTMIDQLPAYQVEDALRFKSFTNLDAGCLQRCIDEGILGSGRHTPLTAFRNLPEGTYQRLKDSGEPVRSIIEALGNMPEADKRAAFSQLSDDVFDSRLIYQYPENFDFMSKDELLDTARQGSRMYDIAVNIEKWTDGSDIELMMELMENSPINRHSISRRLDQLPGLDKEWFVGQLESLEDFTSLAECMRTIPDIDQAALLDKILATDRPDQTIADTLPLFDQMDSSQLLEKLLAAEAYTTIARNPDYFKDETLDTLQTKLSAHPEGLAALVKNIDKFPDTDRQWLAQSLVQAGKVAAVASGAEVLVSGGVDLEWLYGHVKGDSKALSLFCYKYDWDGPLGAISRDRLFDDLLAHDKPELLQPFLAYFPQPRMQEAFVDLCIKHKDTNMLTWGIHNLTLDRLDIAKRCFAAGLEDSIASNWNSQYYLAELDESEIPSTQQLLEWGAAATLLSNLGRYPDTPLSEAFDILIKRGDDEELVNVVDELKTVRIPNEVAEYLAGTKFAYILPLKKELFDPAVFTPALLEKFLESGSSAFTDLYEYSGQRIEWIDRSLQAFGQDPSPALVLAAREVLQKSDGPLPEYLTQLHVNRRGNAGIDQLKSINTILRRQLLRGASDSEHLEAFVSLTIKNPLAKGIAKQLTRFTEAQWGETDEESWEKVLTQHMATRDEHAPLRPEFTPSKAYTVRTIDAKEFDPSRIDIDARERYQALQADIVAAVHIADSRPSDRYTKLFSDGRNILEQELERLAPIRVGLLEEGKTKAIDNLDKRVAAISEVLAMSTREFVATFRNDFSKFSSLKVKGLDSVLRAGIFAKAISKSPQVRSMARVLKTSDITYATLSNMNDFVDHLVNQEVYGDYFQNDRDRKAFEKLSDTAALRQQITKVQNGRSSGETTMQFIPSRGLLLELSGHMGDACWASKYDSIAQEFPNITALTFLRNPGTNTERLVGAGLVIDTTDTETGEPVMVLRGINPIENYINGVKSEDFINSLLDYAKSVTGGRKLAIVIDSESGDAATNRPTVIQFLKEHIKPERTDGKALKLAADSTFNEYVLSANRHPAYYVE